MSIAYKHSYDPISMYGNVVALLRKHATADGVHLDIGCGYGAIAEPVRDELGLTYIGFDLADDGLESLRSRDFIAETVDLTDLLTAEAKIRMVLAGRPVASLTFLDTMEHMPNGPDVLGLLRRLAGEARAPLIVSVPNITHKDIAIKLLMGRLDITEAGILDYTHVATFNHAYLTRVAAARGWVEVDGNDWLLEKSDQFFPEATPFLNHRSPIGDQLRTLSLQSNEHALVNQFVRAYMPAEIRSIELFGGRDQVEGPFLSVLVDTFDAGPEETIRLLGDLGRQEDQDFDIVLIPPSFAGKLDLVPLIKEFGDRLTILEHIEDRVIRLNEGLRQAKGAYVALLTEGDTLSSKWVSALKRLDADHKGSVLQVSRYQSEGEAALDLLGGPIELVIPVPLRGLLSVAEWAMPTAAIRDAGLRVQDHLGAADMRELVLQAALIAGVAVSTEFVVSQQPSAEMRANRLVDDQDYLSLLTRLNSRPLLLPLGAAERIERLTKLPQWRDPFRPIPDPLIAAAARIRQLENSNHDLARHVRADLEQIRATNRIASIVVSNPLLAKFVSSYDLEAVATVQQSTAKACEGPFLSVIMRTQGTASRISTLREALLTLAGQSSQNFEVLLVVHSDDAERVLAVRALVAEFPSEFSERVVLLQCVRPGRSAPLNTALAHIKGRYVAVFDDDDLLFGHWVETFERLAQASPGMMLRGVAAKQDFDLVKGASRERPRAASWFTMEWPSAYDAVEHLRTNHTPFMSMAFPAAAFTQLGLEFDESLTTAEDWQLSTRIAMLTGVADAPDITAIYRWWTNAESSQFTHKPSEWQRNFLQIRAASNGQPVLLPAGTTSKIASLVDENESLHRSVAALGLELAQIRAAQELVAREQELAAMRDLALRNELALQDLHVLVTSRSWRVTKPVRALTSLLRGRKGSGLTLEEVRVEPDEARYLSGEIRRSLSWRLTRPMRVVIRMLRTGRANPN